MVDLFGQYIKIKAEIDHAIQQVIESSAFIRGPEVKAFEQELSRYMDIRHVISCGNGTDALMVSLMALGLKPGDEVITPNFTFGATVEVIALLGLKPVFADVDPATFNIDLSSFESVITSKTKAIIPVHLFGQCSDMDGIMKLAGNYGLFVIEDAAQAISADYYKKGQPARKAGTIGHIGCTSFFPSKNLGCFGDGGAVFTNNDDLARDISAITTHGSRIKYYQDLIGVNSRLDSIQAAILRVKLQHLDEYSDLRRKVADYYDSVLTGLPGLELPARIGYSSHVFHQYTVKLNGIDRVQFRDFLQSKGIPTMIYYPVPLHLQRAFRYLGNREGDFPVTEMLCERVVSLPIHTEMDEGQLEYITGTITEFIKSSHGK